MKCKVCFEDAISNEAGGKAFWYCRTCKIEVKGRKAPATGFSQDPLDLHGIDLGTLTPEEQQEFDDWLDSIAINGDDGPTDDDMDGVN